MKVATEVAIQAPIEKIWSILVDFPKYPEWNRYIEAVEGLAAPDARLRTRVHYYQERPVWQSAVITGFIPNKYLSWVWNHGLGSWFLSTERVFRIRPAADGSVEFHHETYYTGMGLRFRRGDVKFRANNAMLKMDADLKERSEAV